MMTRHPAPGLTPQPGITRSGIGAMIPALYSVPENPILRGNRVLGKGAGPGPGLGFSLSDLSSYIPGNVTQTWSNIRSSAGTLGEYLSSPWVIGGAVVLGLLLLRPGRSAYRGELAEAREQYRERVRRARAKYPRAGSRAYRAALAAGEAF